ncbi:hypothetical protein L198_04727 [Cryptococcus wingfieldii CBS 7118]|uniref:Uncharacterized protein n=1 Tax=Cryptococcus wingfieldii CBS 7118 TaxID=1295528 RepID=A0A1E3J5W6_9TREE|nr:hypothetical protein L198_04727 [Cryptococcus wingfieldii CBS 7118]ODN95331.1 hypothetical protein L198_04727 [Cryptococcus wingfieldii CBS 7118]
MDIYFLFLERVGDAVCASEDDLESLPLATETSIVALYEALHAVRVVHFRHIRRRADGSLCLIDFSGPKIASEGEKGDRELALEMEKVMEMLELEVL